MVMLARVRGLAWQQGRHGRGLLSAAAESSSRACHRADVSSAVRTTESVLELVAAGSTLRPTLHLPV